ncbi:MAG: TIGR00266 family protein [Chloroflexota bacterium]
MEYNIIGTVMPVVEVLLEPGEAVFTESGGMAWMDDGIEMETSGRGGFGKMLGRALSGESLFMTTYTARQQAQMGFTPEVPGNVIAMELSAGQSIIAQRSAFMFAQEGVDLSIHFRRKLGAGFFGGEGFIMQQVTGPGTAFFELGGEIVERNLKPGEVIKVDPGHVAMHDPSVGYDIEMIRGLGNIFAGGEGLFLTRLEGPGKVWLQTMPLMNFARALIPYMPSSGT